MQKLLVLFLLLGIKSSFAQVYNFGANEITFKELIKNGITYVKTGDPHFDSLFIDNLEKHWTVTDFSVVEQYKRPEKTSTALFISTKEWTKKHAMDRKNQHVLLLQPAEVYVPRKDVKMEQTLGYMYLNGFYDLVSVEDEYRFIYVLVKSLNQGISLIKDKRLTGEPADLNEKVSAEITGADGPSVGNTLILNREQTRHTIMTADLDKLNIKYRLLGEEEYYATLESKDPTHIMLYFAMNYFTEMALVRISDGEMLYSKHFRDRYRTIEKKELKFISGYFH
jgi:hypothetical protein